MMPVPRIVVIISVLMALTVPVQYALLAYFPPSGLHFNGIGDDDSITVTSIKYHEFGFQSPWILSSDDIDSSVFLNPAGGPVYIMAALGPLNFLLGLDALAVFVAYKFLSAILALLAVYLLFSQLLKNRKTAKHSFILFALSAGFGGIFYLIFSLLTQPENILYPFTLFGFGVGAFRIIDFYQSFPFALSVFSMLFFVKGRELYSSVLLAVTVLFYPFYAVATALSIFLYWLVFRNCDLKGFAKTFVLPAVFSLVWVYAYARQPLFFSEYSSVVRAASVNIPASILLGFGLPLVFLAYFVGKQKINWSIRSWKIHAVVWVTAVILASVSAASQSVWYRLGTVEGLSAFSDVLRISGEYWFVLYAPLVIILLVSLHDVLKTKPNISGVQKYFLLLLLVLMFVAFFPPNITSILQPKIVGFLAVPVAALAAYGAEALCSRHKIDMKKMLIAVLVVSLPSMFFFYSFVQFSSRDVHNPAGDLAPQTFYFHPDDVAALEALRELPSGVVLSSEEAGAWAPYYSGKKSLLTKYGYNFVTNYEKKKEDVERFFSAAASQSEKQSILQKYGVKYVFIGYFERQKYQAGEIPFLREAYISGDTRIYEVA